MITEIVRFKIDPALSRDDVHALYEKTLPRWRANPDLIRKTYLYDPENGRGGGVYLWTSLEAAQRAHDAEWCDMAERMYGSRPSFEYYETPIVLDNRDDA